MARASDGDVAEAVRESTIPAVSVIVPVTDRPYPLDHLYRQFSGPLREKGLSYEFLFVIGDQWRALLEPLLGLRNSGEPIRILETGQPLSESAMLQVAASHATASRLVTLPSYPRVQPEALLQLLAGLDRGFDLLTAARMNRQDAWINQTQRRAFHALLRGLVGGDLKDVASGVRAMRREVLEELDIFGDSFRFIPFLALREGFQVQEVDVEQHPEDLKTRVYWPGVYLRRIIDLLGLMFRVRFAYKPLRFFGLLGSLLAGLGGTMLLVLFVQKMGGRGIADRPLLLMGVLLVVLGLQAISMGLIGEIVVHHGAGERRAYRIRSVEVRAPGKEEGPGRGEGAPDSLAD